MNRSGTFSKGKLLGGRKLQRGAAWGMMIIAALLAFELFNFSSTDFALRDVLGDLRFLGLRWATILAIAFCGIDFAGVARLFTPEQGDDEPAEVWYLFGAWILAALMNAMLTWWGVSVAIAQSGHIGSAIVSTEVMTKVIPIFVAVMVWLIRVLIIGTFSIAGERLFSQDLQKSVVKRPSQNKRSSSQVTQKFRQQPVARSAATFRSAPKPAPRSTQASFSEPTYHNLSASSGRQQAYDEREQRF